MDYNLLFRWDWESYEPDDWTDEDKEEEDHYSGDKLKIFWMLQRKGAYRFCEIKVNREDEDKVKSFLKPRWEYMKAMWEPFL